MSRLLSRDKLLSYSPYIIYIFFMSYLAFRSNLALDDLAFREIFSENLFQWLINWYFTWSSRLFIGMFLPALCYFPIIWKILNVAVSLLLFYSLQKLLCNTHLSRFALLLFMLMFPYFDLESAGWITTTLVFWWPLSFGVFSLLSLKKAVENERLHWYEYIIFSVSLLFAANNELLAIVLFAVFLVYSIYFMLNKKHGNPAYIIIQAALCLISILFAVTAPGNQVRSVAEIQRWLPQFTDFNFLDNLYLGFITTMHHVFIRDNLIFITFCVLLAVVVFHRHKEWLYRSVAAFPIITSVFLSEFLPGSLEYRLVSFYLDGSTIVYPPLYAFIFVIIIFSTVLSVYYAFGKSKCFLMIVFIIGLGFLSRVMMGFSPTLFASSERTFTFLWACFIYCSMIVYNELEDMLAPKAIENVFFILLIAFAFSPVTVVMVNKLWGAF